MSIEAPSIAEPVATMFGVATIGPKSNRDTTAIGTNARRCGRSIRVAVHAAATANPQQAARHVIAYWGITSARGGGGAEVP